MPTSVESLAPQFLQLSADNRARLFDQGISGPDAYRERDTSWNALAARRDADADDASWVPGPDALARVRAGIG